MPLIVTLTPREIWHAVIEGVNRRTEELAKGRRGRFDVDPRCAWGIDIEVAAAELAVAKGLQLHWSGIAGDSAPDVFGLEVRSALHDSDSLIVPESAKDDCRYVFVTGHIPTFVIRGWIVAKDGKQARFIRPSKAAGIWFWIPISALYPIEDLLSTTPELVTF